MLIFLLFNLGFQFFETTFELAWKLMKDYMEFQGSLYNKFKGELCTD
jgi:hypothetical protein